MLNRPSLRVHRSPGLVAVTLMAAFSLWFGWFATHQHRDDLDLYGSARRPLVLVGGQTEQVQAADYIQSVGGISANSTPAATGDIEATTGTVSSQFTAGGQFATSGTLTITTWSTNQTLNDWNPTGLAAANVISVEQSSNTTHITGIAAQPTGTEITICNRETSVGVVKLDYETGSTSANQIVLPGAASFGFPWEIQPGACLKLRYGGSNWMFISSGTSLLPYIHVRNGADLDGSTTVNQLKYTPQIDTSTGTVDNFVLFSTTTAIVWGGAGDATFTGMIGGGDGRMACIINASSGKTLTLANMSGSSSHPYQNIDNKDSPLVGAGSFACYIYDATASPAPWRMYSWGSSTNPAATSFTSSKNKGTITLSTGTGTATVNAGAICTCQDTSGTPTLVSCAVSSTTLTATGTGTDAIAYLCF